MRKTLHILLVLLCATACIYPYDFVPEEAPEGVLVVEGDILIGGISSIGLRTMVSLSPEGADASASLPDDARAWVEDDAGTLYTGRISDSGRTGITFSIPMEDAPSGRKYRACAEAFGERYSSDWVLPLKGPVIRDINFTTNETQVLVNVSLEGGEDATGYLALSYDEAWEFHADYSLDFKVIPGTWVIVPLKDADADQNFWCWKYADNHQTFPLDITDMQNGGVTDYPLFRFPRYDNRNHRKYCVNLHAKTISKETYRYLKHLEESYESGNDLFSPNPGEMPGNLHCETDPDRRVLGYVTASVVTNRRAFLNSRYYIARKPNYDLLLYLLAHDYPTYYDDGYRPLIENPHTDYDPGEEGPYGWGAKRCYDCIAAGGTTTPPDYWNNPLEDPD